MPEGSWFFNYVRQLLAGDDIFLSYSGEDGRSIVAALHEELERRDLRCYYDLLDSEADHELTADLKWRIRIASMLVVICTPGAARSKHVREEIGIFERTGRKPYFVGEIAAGEALMPGMRVSALESAADDIVRAFTYRRIRDKRRRFAWRAAGSVLIVTAIIGWALSAAWIARRDALDDTALAQSSLGRIEQLRSVAEKARAEAMKQAAEATKLAAEQRDIALARQFASRAVELAADGGRVPIRAPLLAAAASLRRRPNAEALEIADRLAPLVPNVERALRYKTRVWDVDISASGQWYVIVADYTLRVYSCRRGLRWQRRFHNGPFAIDISPDESLLLFTTEDGGEQRLSILSLEDVDRLGGRAEARPGFVVPIFTRHAFFSRDSKSVFASDNTLGKPAITHAARVDKLTSFEKYENLDARAASDRWIVGRTFESPRALVVIDRATGSRFEHDTGGEVVDVTLSGDYGVVAFRTKLEGDVVVTHVRRVRLSDPKHPFQEVIRAEHFAQNLAFAKDGSTIVSSESVALQRATVSGGQLAPAPRWSHGHSGPYLWHRDFPNEPRSIRVSGVTAAVVYGDGNAISAIDALSGEELARFNGEKAEISANGRFAIVRNGEEATLLRLAIARPRSDHEHPLALNEHGNDLVQRWKAGGDDFVDDNERVVTYGEDNERVVESSRWRKEIPFDAIFGALSRSGRYAVFLWGAQLDWVDLRSGQTFQGQYGSQGIEIITAAAVSDDERWVVFAIGARSKPNYRDELLDVTSGERVTIDDLPQASASDLDRVGVAISAHGSFIATSSPQTMRIYGPHKTVIHERSGRLLPVAFAPDSSIAVIALPTEIVIFDLRRRVELARTRLEDDEPGRIVFRNDSQAFFVTARGGMRPQGERHAIHIFDRAGKRIANVLSDLAISDAVWNDARSIRALTGFGTRLLTWNAEHTIENVCRSLQRDRHPLPATILTRLGPEILDDPPCGPPRRDP